VFSEDDWHRLRDAGEVDKLTALAAFGASFGGRKWGGFARPDLRWRQSCEFGRAVRSWRRKFDAMSSAGLVTSECLPYWRVDPPAGSVVYCDPPYTGTTGYNSGEFDHGRFHAWCEAQTVPVFVSEFTAPAHWRVVFEKDQTRSIRSGYGSKMPEKLFRAVR
jgi:DNA adenine methylase